MIDHKVTKIRETPVLILFFLYTCREGIRLRPNGYVGLEKTGERVTNGPRSSVDEEFG